MSRAVRCVLLAVSLITALVANPASGQPDPDQPFGTPQYLIHITGHGTTSGGVKDDALIIHPSEPDGEGKSADERLVEALAASRAALGDISEKLARSDMAAFETQGRFIESRYGRDEIDVSADHS